MVFSYLPAYVSHGGGDFLGLGKFKFSDNMSAVSVVEELHAQAIAGPVNFDCVSARPAVVAGIAIHLTFSSMLFSDVLPDDARREAPTAMRALDAAAGRNFKAVIVREVPAFVIPVARLAIEHFGKAAGF
jgi:hypothetical protein